MIKKIILCMCIISILLVDSISVNAATVISKKSEPNRNWSSSLLYAGKKYILANEKGIFVSKKPEGKWKKITSKYKGNGQLFISNGKTIYFATVTPGSPDQNKYSIYSIKTDGKKLRKVKSGKGLAELIAVYKNNLYFGSNSQDYTYCTKIIKYNLKSKKTKCVSGKYNAGRFGYLNGKIYFSGLVVTSEANNTSPLYSLNLKNNKIKKEIKRCSAYNLSKGSSSLYVSSYYYNINKGYKTDNYIYKINSKHKKTRFKKLPNDINSEIVNKNGKFVIYRTISNDYTKNTYYRRNLKTGSQKKIIGTNEKYYYNVINDIKNADLYFVKEDDYGSDSLKIKVYKLIGTKIKSMRISGKKSIVLNESYNVNNKWTHGNYWISGSSFITTEKGRIKTFKLK